MDTYFYLFISIDWIEGATEPDESQDASTELPPDEGSQSPHQAALIAATHATELFSRVLGSGLPWKALRQNSTQLNRPGAQLTKENAELLGNIKTSYENGFNEHDSTAQTVIEWCEYATSTLPGYVQLSAQNKPAYIKMRTKSLLRVLNNALEKFGRGGSQVGALSKAFNELSRQFSTLVGHLKRDYNENSAYFQERLKRLLGATQTPNPSRRPSKRPRPTTESSDESSTDEPVTEDPVTEPPNPEEVARATATLKKQLSAVLAFYESSSAAIRKAVSSFNRATAQLPKHVQVITEQKPNIEKEVNAPAPAEGQESASNEGAVHAAERLISVCQQFHQEQQ